MMDGMVIGWLMMLSLALLGATNRGDRSVIVEPCSSAAGVDADERRASNPPEHSPARYAVVDAFVDALAERQALPASKSGDGTLGLGHHQVDPDGIVESTPPGTRVAERIEPAGEFDETAPPEGAGVSQVL